MAKHSSLAYDLLQLGFPQHDSLAEKLYSLGWRKRLDNPNAPLPTETVYVEAEPPIVQVQIQNVIF